MTSREFLLIASELEEAGLIWQPEIGDEVLNKTRPTTVSILVDPMGMTPSELRESYLWLPTLEQLVNQLEARQAILFHAGLELTAQQARYKSVIESKFGHIETVGNSLRTAVGLSLRELLIKDGQYIH